MFRNFYDKFALGFIFIYAILLSLSLVIVIKNFKQYRLYIYLALLIVITLNTLPIKEVVNKKLWTTNNVYTSISIPDEYMKFMAIVKKTVDPTSYILSLPFNIGGYTFIKDVNSNSVYAGTSPVKIFTGINDIAGNYSFPGAWYGAEIKEWWMAIMERDYDAIRKKMKRFHLNYVFVTKNIPNEVKNSYLFDRGDKFKPQDKEFISAITDKKLFVSSNGNYEMYSAKEKKLLIDSKNIYFQKINPTKYLIHFSNLKNKQDLLFFESFHPGWKLYVSRKDPDCISSKNFVAKEDSIYECSYKNNLYEGEEISYLWKKTVFENTHSSFDESFNKWIIDPAIIKEKPFDYTKNKDGSINMSLILYFNPQSYFYLGSILSLTVFLIGFIILLLDRSKHD